MKVTLKDSCPSIWRRIQVPGNMNLLDLHDVFQAVMGWQDSHLHQFNIDCEMYTDMKFEEFTQMIFVDMGEVIGDESKMTVAKSRRELVSLIMIMILAIVGITL